MNIVNKNKERFGQGSGKKSDSIKKRLIRILCCLTLCCFSNFTYGQNLDSLNSILNQYFKLILVKDYSINPVSIDKEFPHTRLNLEGHSLYLDISTNDRLLFPEIIKKTNEYSSLSKNIRVKTAALCIYNGLIKTNYISKELKKGLVCKILRLSESVSDNAYEEIKLLDSSYFNLEARNRIREILNDRLSPEEIFLQKQLETPAWKVEDSIKDKGLVRSFKKYSVHGSMKFNEWIDSINTTILNNYFANYSLIRNGIINLIGNSLLFEFAPKLEELYANPKYAHRKEQIKLVLARFQYKDYETKALAEINAEIHKGNWEKSIIIYKWEKELLYISTQKSLFIYSDFLKTTITRECDEFSSTRINMGYDFLCKLCKIINNIPAKKYYRNLQLWSLCDKVTTFPKDIIDQSYRWMKKNEGKYEIKSLNISDFLY